MTLLRRNGWAQRAATCANTWRCGVAVRGAFAVRIMSAACVFSLAFALAEAPAAAQPQPSIALLDCALLDDNAAYNDAELTRAQLARAAMVSDTLRAQLHEHVLYRVADNAPARELIASLAATQNLNACNGCELDVGRKLGVDKVGVCWVQKISNLILNINLRIEDVRSGQTVFQRSVDIRGNTDVAWRRGATALVDLVAAARGQP
jgi:hypothetical protein